MSRTVLLWASAVLAVLLASGALLLSLDARYVSAQARSGPNVIEGASPPIEEQVDAASGSKIAFSQGVRGSRSDIFKMNHDGTKVKRLTHNDAVDRDPAWSPDGTKIAFTRYRSGYFTIYRMNADGTDVIRLTSNSVNGIDPAWSPDGTKIAFTTGSGDMYVINADGTDVTNITPAGYFVANVSWSPDGTRIAFSGSSPSSDYPVKSGLHVMNSDGTGLTHLAPSPPPGGVGLKPDWSPDGTKIAYTSDSVVWVVNADGNENHELRATFSDYTGGSPSWSPDGTKILCSILWYRGDKPDVRRVIKVKADGTVFGDGSQYRQVYDGFLMDADWGPKKW